MADFSESMVEVGESVREPETRHRNHYVQILRRKTLHLMAVFLLAYVSLEITINGISPTSPYPHGISLDIGVTRSSEGIPHFIRTRSTATDSGSSYLAFISPAFLSGKPYVHYIMNNGSGSRTHKGSLWVVFCCCG
jgi:hypothetical protein